MERVMVWADPTANYQTKEAAVFVVGLVWVLALGSVVLAALILCGWKGAKKIAFDWWHMKVTFWCR